MVLIDHLLPTMQHYTAFSSPILKYTVHIGYTGVLAFFVHTSLVLMYSLERMHRESDHVALRFYVRRFFRLYPLAIFAIVLVLALGIPSNTWYEPTSHTWQEITANLLLVQNLWVRKDVIGPLWSLPYEVQMYIVFPALYLVSRKRLGPIYLSGLYLAACGLGTLLWIFTGHENFGEFIPCFLSGILCYSLRNRIKPFIPGVFWPLFVVGWIAAFCLVIEVQYWHAWIFCLVLGLAINCFHDSPARWLNLAAARVALYSYGMYLLHVPVLYLIFEWMNIENVWVAGVLEFTMTFAVAAVTYHVLEERFIELGRRLSGARGRLDPVVASAAP